MFQNTKIALITIIIIHIGFAIGCFYRQDLNLEISNTIQTINANDEEKKIESPVNIPKGNEIEVSIRIITSKKAIFTIKNNSSETIYLPYLSGDKNGFAYFINYELEKKNAKNGEWEIFPPGDFGSGFHPLESKEFIKGSILVTEKGTYRINISYMIDRLVYEKINTISKISDIKERLNEYDKVTEEIDLSRMVITSIPFKL